MLAPNLDPGSSGVEIGPAAENAMPAQRDALASSRSRCRAFGAVVAF
jgi:hypothetical protein